MDAILSPVEARVLACLIEKSVTTPEYYPLTLNALTVACGQKSNREPIMELDGTTVVRALDTLRDKKLAWIVSTAGGRVPKYSHRFTDVYPVEAGPLVVLCELMLRGPQTAAELRTHAGRMAEFRDVGEVQSILQELASRDGGPLVCQVPRLAGQREERYGHLLCGKRPEDEMATASPPEAARVAVMAENERLATLESRVAALTDDMARLKAEWADFARQFQ